MFQCVNFSIFDYSYLNNKFIYLAQTWLFTQEIRTTDVVKSLFKLDRNLFICIAHDSVRTQSLDLIEFRYKFPFI